MGTWLVCPAPKKPHVEYHFSYTATAWSRSVNQQLVTATATSNRNSHDPSRFLFSLLYDEICAARLIIGYEATHTIDHGLRK